jgi:hypothetical protein
VTEKSSLTYNIGKIADRPISAEPHGGVRNDEQDGAPIRLIVEEVLKDNREVNRCRNDGLGRTDVKGEV